MNNMDYSSAGLAMTCRFEGLELNAYQDPGGVWTIGYGHTGPEVQAGETITMGQAVALLHADMATAIKIVQNAVTIQLTQNQFDALVDFCYNVGHLVGTTLLVCVNKGDFAGATAQFGLWVHQKGVVLPGLVARRAAEAAMFSQQTNQQPAQPSQPQPSPSPQPSTDVGEAEP